MLGFAPISAAPLASTGKRDDVSLPGAVAQGGGTIPLTGAGTARAIARGQGGGTIPLTGAGTATAPAQAQGGGVIPLLGGGVAETGSPTAVPTVLRMRGVWRGPVRLAGGMPAHRLKGVWRRG